MSWIFSPTRCSSNIELSNNNQTATHKGSGSGWEIAVCDGCIESKSFKVRIEKNPTHIDLCIGFIQFSEAFPLEVVNLVYKCWMIDIGNQQIFECGLRGPRGQIVRGDSSVVTVEKDPAQCALRFYVNEEDVNDRHNKPYGWRPTYLSQVDFDTLAGFVSLCKIDTEVSIVNS
jgi:hypothetical protein